MSFDLIIDQVSLSLSLSYSFDGALKTVTLNCIQPVVDDILINGSHYETDLPEISSTLNSFVTVKCLMNYHYYQLYLVNRSQLHVSINIHILSTHVTSRLKNAPG